ncbi:hypothetical protein [Nitrosomonas sp. Nm132]|uniref:hypothetical protein n=1 Tax=Nitrosomonas sp. Nm132 TaxID=1881053 RepID=UPI0008927892|nr:hypothetical protein [Nitrosomonas sp. Nm132]SDI01041.1 hypothetical protein SAMN05428952_105812 [Nitrosomonas sp. Nm132]
MKEIDWLAGGSGRKRIKGGQDRTCPSDPETRRQAVSDSGFAGILPLACVCSAEQKCPLPKNTQFITPTYPQRNWDKFHADFRLPQLIYPFHQNQRIRIHLDDQDS